MRLKDWVEQETSKLYDFVELHPELYDSDFSSEIWREKLDSFERQGQVEFFFAEDPLKFIFGDCYESLADVSGWIPETLLNPEKDNVYPFPLRKVGGGD